MHTTYKVVFSDKSKKQLKKIDHKFQNQILNYLDKIDLLNNPKIFGKALTANLKGLWRYRVDDYRIICEIKEKEILILVLEINHRKEAYK